MTSCSLGVVIALLRRYHVGLFEGSHFHALLSLTGIDPDGPVNKISARSP
jgi:hypothetical protein